MHPDRKISVKKLVENQVYIFQVNVEDNGTQSSHTVSLNTADYQRITQGRVEPETLIYKAFEFLLEREPKEKILKKFDFTVISRYFPSFKKDIIKILE